MENATPPVEGLREEPHCRWKYLLLNTILQALCHARGLREEERGHASYRSAHQDTPFGSSTFAAFCAYPWEQ